jgi:hypothetical protein
MDRNPARRSFVVAVMAIALAFGFAFAHGVRKVDAAAPSDQGCVNQGSDRRECATVICWLQRQLSRKSEHEPHFVLIGNPQGTNLGLAWPPYLVFNTPTGANHWNMFRIGFRYDRTWRGYIFPAIAAKRVSQPLRY